MDTNIITRAAKSNNVMHKKKEQGLVTRQKILAAAEHVFFEKGAALTSLEQIAETANVTRGAIYGHFKNKNMLLDHVIDSAIIHVIDIIRSALTEAPKPSFEQLRKATIDTILTIACSPGLTRRLSIAMLKCEYTEEFSYIIEKHTHYRDEVHDLLMTYYSNMEKCGIVLPKEPEKMAEALLFYTTGLLTEFFKHPDKLDIEKDIADYLDIFFFSVSKPPA